MTHWKLWEEQLEQPLGFEPSPWFALTGERWKRKAVNETGRRETRRACEGKLVALKTASRRFVRRDLKRLGRWKTRPLFRTGRGTWA